MCILTIRILLYFIILLSNIDDNIIKMIHLHFIKTFRIIRFEKRKFYSSILFSNKSFIAEQRYSLD